MAVDPRLPIAAGAVRFTVFLGAAPDLLLVGAPLFQVATALAVPWSISAVLVTVGALGARRQPTLPLAATGHRQ